MSKWESVYMKTSLQIPFDIWTYINFNSKEVYEDEIFSHNIDITIFLRRMQKLYKY